MSSAPPNPSGLCLCGCGERTRLAPCTRADRGWVKGEPQRFLPRHNLRKSPVEYIVDPATGCWVWQRSTSAGYGNIGRGGRSYRAHRVYYERVHGPIPVGLEIDHLCRNRACVNPAHLEPVTHAENGRRGRSAKLRESDVIEIRRRYAEGGALQTQLAAEYGIHPAQVSRIVTNKKWRDLSIAA